jgi:cell division protein FtsQ
LNVRRRQGPQKPLLSTAAMARIASVMLAVALLLAIAGAVGWLIERPAFDIRVIEVRGDAAPLRHVSAVQVRSLARKLRGNFFTLSLPAARRQFESLPWAAAVSVRRGWPDRLIVTVTEHRPIGLWDDGRLLADSGRLFVANVAEAELHVQLASFSGPPAEAAAAAQRFAEFGQVLGELGLSIRMLEVSDRRSWTVTTDLGQRFELGRDEPPGALSQRLTLVAQHYPTMVAQFGAAPSRIDARYPQALAASPAARKKP